MEQYLPAFNHASRLQMNPNKYLPFSIWIHCNDILKNIIIFRKSENKKIKDLAEMALKELTSFNLQGPKCGDCENVAKYFEYCKYCKKSFYSECLAHNTHKWHYNYIHQCS